MAVVPCPQRRMPSRCYDHRLEGEWHYRMKPVLRHALELVPEAVA